MYENVSLFTKDHIYYIRDGLLDEGWLYHQDLPPGWMFKQYNHKIEGVSTDILILMSPTGSVFRSKIKIKKEAKHLGLSDDDLQQLIEFKSEMYDEPKKIDEPDSDWVYDEEFVPLDGEERNILTTLVSLRRRRRSITTSLLTTWFSEAESKSTTTC